MKFLSQINVNTEYTLPIVDGTNGQVLTTDGSGAVYWGSISAGSTNLNALTDVELTNPTSGQILRYAIPPGGSLPVWYNWTPTYLTSADGVTISTTQTITGAKTFTAATTMNIASGSSVALTITKAGNGEGLIVNKTSGSGNAVTITGTLQATAIVKTGGTSSQFLKADGSVDTSSYLTSESDTLATVTGRGATTSSALTLNGNVSVGTLASLSFGSATRQMINLWSTIYGIGVQSSTQYFRTGGGFAWFLGGVHSNTANDPGTGGTLAMRIDASSNLIITGSVTSSSFIKSGGTASQFLKADGSVDTNTYLTAHPPIVNGGSVNNSNGTVVQDITVDANGHVTAIGSTNLDTRYYTQDDISALFGGDIAIAGYNLINWDTAYSWGNHASAGYLTSFTETDPTVPAHVKSITTTNISNWNTAYGWGNHASAGYQSASTAVELFDYLWTNPVFGQYGIKNNLIDNILYSAQQRFTVLKDGGAYGGDLFNANYDQWQDIIPAGQSVTYTIQFNTKNNPSYGIVYPWGKIYLSFYYVQIPASVVGRSKDQNGVWSNLSGWTNVANNGSYAVWSADINGSNYLVELEITITAAAGIDTWFAQWEYVLGRPGQFENGIISKFQDNSIWRTIFFKDSSNNNRVTIGSGGISTDQAITINGTSSLYFGSYGGGFYMQDGTWIRTVGNRSIWVNDGYLGGQAGLTIGYGGTPPNEYGGAVFAGKVGIGTTGPSTKLDVNGVITATGGNSTQWNTAYGWGNHSGLYLPISGGNATGWVSFSSSTQGTPIIKAIQQDSSSGYYLFQGITGSSEVFRVERTGNLVTSGTLSASGYNKTNWDTAYGWGNHADAGYLTSYSYTETDTLATVTGRGGSTGSLVVLYGKVTLGNNSSGTYNGNTNGLTLNSTAEIRSTGVQNPPALTWHYEGLATRHLLMTSGGALNFVSPSNEASGVAVVQINGNNIIHAGTIGSQSVAYSTASTRVYAADSPYRYGDQYPYYMEMRYDGTYWNLSVTPATPSAVRVAYADNAGSAGYAASAGSATNLYGAAGSYIKMSTTGTSYQYNYQVRENDGGGSNTNEIYAPQLAFHWSGVVASSIMMEASGRIAIRNNPGTGYENFIASVIYSSGYGNSTQWNTAYGWGNHALAGYATQTWVGLNYYNEGEIDDFFSGAEPISGYNKSNWDAAYNDKIASAAFNTINGVLTLTQQDGGTVTVDLDGRYVTSDSDSQELTWDGGSKTLGITGGNSVILSELATEDFVTSQGYVTSAHTHTIANVTGLQTALDSKLSAEADTLATVTGRGASTTNAIAVRGITTTKDTAQLTINRVDTTGANWNFYSWAGGLNIFPNTQLPIYIGRDGSVTDLSLWNGKLLFGDKNTIEGGDSWLRLNQSGQYGSGVYTPYILRNDGQFINYGGIVGYATTKSRKAQIAGDYTTAALWTESYDSTATGIAFHISGNVGKFLEMRTNGILYWNGDTVWHSGNDGAGTGLDADLLDGNHASAFALASHTHPYLPLSGGTVTGDINTNSAIAFIDGNSGYSNIIRSAGYPSEGYDPPLKYWMEYRAYGGHHFVLNVDGGVGAGENSMDDFVVWQGAIDGDKLLELSNAGNLTIRGTFTESSSIRFKENITPLDPTLDKVNQLEAVSYNKIGVDDREIGLIAEDVAELFPEVVTYNEDGQPQGIQYQRLSVILLKAVQELTERVNKLENK